MTNKHDYPYSLLLPVLLVLLLSFINTNIEAETLKEATGRANGIVYLPQAESSADIEYWLNAGKYHVIAQVPKESVVKVRQWAVEQGVHAERCWVSEQDGSVPLGPGYADIVILPEPGAKNSLSSETLKWVLSPSIGTALIGGSSAQSWSAKEKWGETEKVTAGSNTWIRVRAPRIPGTDDWTHRFYDGSNNPVSSDSLASKAFMLQFTARPIHAPVGTTMLAAGGRYLNMLGPRNRGWTDSPGNNWLIIRNAYSGKELWRREIPTDTTNTFGGNRSPALLTEKLSLVIELGDLISLDPDTGGELKKIDLPGRDILSVRMAAGQIIAMTGPEEPRMKQISREYRGTYFYDSRSFLKTEKNSLGLLTHVIAYSPDNFKKLWEAELPAKGQVSCSAADDSLISVYCPGFGLVGLNSKTGKEVWRNTGDEVKRHDGKAKALDFGDSGYLIITPKAVIIVRNLTQGFDPATGKFKWNIEKAAKGRFGAPHILWQAGKLVVEAGQGWLGWPIVDPDTGQLSDKRVPRPVGGGCDGRVATQDAIIGNYFSGAKSGCDQGVIPALGQVFSLATCHCVGNFPGSLALARSDWWLKGPANIMNLKDPGRRTFFKKLPPSGNRDKESSESGKGKPAITWKYTPENPYAGPTDGRNVQSWNPEQLSSTPVFSNGRILFSGSDGVLRCLDSASGKEVWRFITGARILEAPAVDRGRCYVGSGDGHVYAIDMKDGSPGWSFDLRVMPGFWQVFGHFESPWPVHSGIIVKDNTVYAVSGNMYRHGAVAAALSAEDGRLIWITRPTHTDRSGKQVEILPCGQITLNNNLLYVPDWNAREPLRLKIEDGTVLDSDTLWKHKGRLAGSPGSFISVTQEKWLVRGGAIRDMDNQHLDVNHEVSNPGLRWHPLDKDGLLQPGIRPFGTNRLNPAYNDDFLVITRSDRRDIACYSHREFLSWCEKTIQSVPKDEKRPFLFKKSSNVLSGKSLENVTVCKPLWVSDVIGKALLLRKGEVVIAHSEMEGYTNKGRQLFRPTYVWRLTAHDPATGKEKWTLPLPGEPRDDGMTNGPDGSIIMTLADGSVLRIDLK